jgi:hypothetical protein
MAVVQARQVDRAGLNMARLCYCRSLAVLVGVELVATQQIMAAVVAAGVVQY